MASSMPAKVLAIGYHPLTFDGPLNCHQDLKRTTSFANGQINTELSKECQHPLDTIIKAWKAMASWKQWKAKLAMLMFQVFSKLLLRALSNNYLYRFFNCTFPERNHNLQCMPQVVKHWPKQHSP